MEEEVTEEEREEEEEAEIDGENKTRKGRYARGRRKREAETGLEGRCMAASLSELDLFQTNLLIVCLPTM